MTIEKQITRIEERLTRLVENAMLAVISIGYKETMKVMKERYPIEEETEEEETE